MLDRKYPTDWRLVPLREIIDAFLSGGTPSTSVPDYWDGTIPWITGADAEERVVTTARKYITRRGVQESSTNVVPKGNILLVTRTGVGKVSISGVDVAISQDLTGIILKQDMADVGYLYRQLAYFGPQLQKLAQGTIIQGIQREEVEAQLIPLPSLPEQRRIAEILDAADEAIRQTEQLIAKLKAIKAGLLHDLLTRGLDEHGHLRDPQAHPEQFKDSPLGRIPREWEVETLGEVCTRSGGSIQIGPFGSQLHAKDYKNEGVPIITVEHLGDNEILHRNLPLVGDADYKRLQRYGLQAGDLVFSRVGAIDRCAFVSELEDGWLFSGRCLRVRTGSGLLNPRFLSYQLNGHVCRRWILNHSVGSTMACLNTVILSQVPVLVPPIPEQETIVTVLNAHDGRIRTEEADLAKLRQVKRGLMGDLLTGKVRVQV